MAEYWPWLTFQSITFLRNRLTPEMNVFEYSCGSSTIFYAKRCKSVIAVEHNREWSPKVVKTLEQLGLQNWEVHQVQAEDVKPDGCSKNFLDTGSYFSKGWAKWFKKYAHLIEQTDDQYDVISVDGGARVSCMKHAIPKLSPGGFLILDNSERPRYQSGIDLIPADWKRWDFLGIGSVNAWRAAVGNETRTKKWQTTIWQRLAA